MRVWNLPEQAAAQTAAYAQFMSIPAMSMGIYKLPAGGVDEQSPHAEDEAYYVLKGKARIEVEGVIQPVKPGALIFVAAQAQHRFIDIEEDRDLLVFFAPAHE
jgi:mannose-6-phosphate isomerase-like protein (cupin superfamily)